jgi:hypothetical protein
MARKSRRFTLIVVFFVLIAAGGGIYALTVASRPASDIDPSRLAVAERGNIARSVVAVGRIEPVTFKYRNRQVGIACPGKA